MKGVILGMGLFIGNMIGVTGIIIAIVLNGTLDGRWFDAIQWQGLLPLFAIFSFMAFLGVVIAITSFFTSREQNK